MTRSEFLDDVNSWSELISFCDEYGCDYCSDIYDEEQRDDVLNGRMYERARQDSWRDVYEWLDEIETGYDYYREDDYGDFVGLDDSEFDSYKDDVLSWMDINGYWDDEELEDEDDEIEESASEPIEEEEAVEEEDFSAAELIGMCSVAFAAIQQENMKKIQEDRRMFDEYVDINMPKVLK